MPFHICIVSPGNLASNPRLLKEAAALHEAGYRVTTVICNNAQGLRESDDALVRAAPWNVVRVPQWRGERYFRVFCNLAARGLDWAGIAIPLPIAAAAYGGPAATLRSATQSIRADLYIAHYVVALPAAANAARRHAAVLGFDAEDFHSGEGGEGEAEAFRMKLVQRIEHATLSACRYATASSPKIGQAYEKAYGIRPITILNMFPLSMAPDQPSRDKAQGLRCYWFSQTIGLDRGLQVFLQAMALSGAHVTLDIRGNDPWGHGRTIQMVAGELGIAERVRLLPLAPPEQMARLAVSYDLGLSLEMAETENKRLCLGNKIFTYLLAGIPVMLSDTPAQMALAAELGAAASVVSVDDPRGIARALDRLAVPAALAEAKATAWRRGRERYNWDREKRALIEAVRVVFDRRSQDQVCQR